MARVDRENLVEKIDRFEQRVAACIKDWQPRPVETITFMIERLGKSEVHARLGATYEGRTLGLTRVITREEINSYHEDHVECAADWFANKMIEDFCSPIPEDSIWH